MQKSIYLLFFLLFKSSNQTGDDDDDNTHLFNLLANGKNSRRIIGGHYSYEGQFPFMVSFRLHNTHFCAGTIINNEWIISAAHCFQQKEYYTNGTIHVGTTTLDSTGSTHYFSAVIPHELYNKMNYYNDICLIRAYPQFKFSEFVQPIRLNLTPLPPLIQLTIIGWGDEIPVQGELSNVLKFGYATLLDDWQCSLRMQLYLAPTLMCALPKMYEGSCFGDSGGPIVYDDQFVGISSFGRNCGNNLPNMFTKIYLMVNWIANKVNQYSYGQSNSIYLS